MILYFEMFGGMFLNATIVLTVMLQSQDTVHSRNCISVR